MRKTWFYLLCLFVAHGLLFGWVDLWSLAKSRGDFTPFAVSNDVSSVTYDESQLYAPGPMHFFRLGTVATEVDVRELAHLPNGYPTFHIWAIGTMAKMVGGIGPAWMLAHALFPACVWLLFAVMYRSQGASWLMACVASTLTVWLPMAPRNALFMGMDPWIQPMEITRTPHPSLSLALLLAFVVTLARWLPTEGWRGGWVPACFCASLFYAYYFMWLSAGMAIGIMMLLLAVTKQWRVLRRLLAVSSVAVLLALPYLARAIAGVPATTERGGALPLMQRVGLFTHDLRLVWLILALVATSIVVLGCLRWEAQRRNYTLWLAASLVAAGLFGLNLHLFTGYDAQHEHFINRVVQPFGFFAGMSVLLLILGGWLSNSVIRRLATLSMLAVLTTGFVRQTGVAENTLRQRRLSNDRIQVLTWIRDHTSADVVIGTLDEQLLTLTPTFTGAWNFVPLGDRSMAANDEILVRYCCIARLLSLSLEEVLKRLSADVGGAKNGASTGYVLLMQRPISPTSLDWVRQHYVTLKPAEILGSRRLDYVVASSQDAANLSPDQFEKVGSTSLWQVFRNTLR